MALIKCPECGHKVSDSAETCPECGFGISQYLYEQRIIAKKKQIAATPEKDDSWVKPIADSVMRIKRTYLICLAVSAVLLALFLVLMIMFNSVATILLFVFLLILTVVFSILFSTQRKNCWKVFKEEGSTILFFVKGQYYQLYVDNNHANDVEDGVISYRLPSGSIIHGTLEEDDEPVVWKEDFTKFEPKPNVRTKTIVNNYVTNNITKTGNRAERSDMEKILIKNAKIDALASIDPTNTEKAKEQIDIVNKLDDLD